MPVIRRTPPSKTITGPLFESYFANIKAGTALSPDYVSVDYSLQLQIGNCASHQLRTGESAP
jgi:hypothetical protein